MRYCDSWRSALWLLFGLLCIAHGGWSVHHVGFESVSVQQVYSTGTYEFATLLNREGIYRRAAGTTEWIEVCPPVVCSAASPSIFKMAHCGRMVYTNANIYSNDSGKTWQESSTYFPIEHLLHSDGRLFVTNNDTIKFSDDGYHWHIAKVGERSYKALSQAGGLLFASYYGGLEVSRDRGLSWEDISGGLPERTAIGSVVQINDNAFLVTTDNGFYWSSLYKFAWYAKKLFIAGEEVATPKVVQQMVTVDTVVYGFSRDDQISQSDLVYRYEYKDGAVIASPLPGQRQRTRFAISVFGDKLALAGYDGVRLYDTVGEWDLAGEGFARKPRVFRVCQDEKRVFALSNEGNMYYLHRSLDGGTTWDSIYAAYNSDALSLRGDTLTLSGYPASLDSVFRSYDGGDSWQTVVVADNDTVEIDTGQIIPQKIIWRGGDRVIGHTMKILGGGKTAVFYTYISEDGGESFELAEGVLSDVREIADNGHGQLLGERYNDLALSTDSGVTWRVLDIEPPRDMLAYHKNIIFAEIQNGDEWEFVYGYSTDMGKSWQPLLDTAGGYFHCYLPCYFEYGKATIIRDGLIYVRDLTEIGGTAIVTQKSPDLKRDPLKILNRKGSLEIACIANRITPYKAALYSVGGREILVKEGRLSPAKSSLSLQLFGVASGVYILQLDLAGNSFQRTVSIP